MNAGEVFVCAGVESMTRIPMGGYNYMPNPALYETCPQAYISMGDTAENLARQYHINRIDQEAFSLLSQQKAYSAKQQGRFADEIISIGRVDKDGCIRADSTAASTRPTASGFPGNGQRYRRNFVAVNRWCGSGTGLQRRLCQCARLDMLARIKAIAVSGCAPEIMGIRPVAATHKALQRAGLDLDDIDIVELNEAFAAQAIAVLKAMPVPRAQT